MFWVHSSHHAADEPGGVHPITLGRFLGQNRKNAQDFDENSELGGEAGIRTLDTGFGPYNGLANRRLQPLGHLTARES
jgi:hypothetical protein